MVTDDIGISGNGIRSSSHSSKHLNQIALIKDPGKIQNDHTDIFNRDPPFQNSCCEDEAVFLVTEILDVPFSFRQIGIDLGTGKETGKDPVENFTVLLAGGENDTLSIYFSQ